MSHNYALVVSMNHITLAKATVTICNSFAPRRDVEISYELSIACKYFIPLILSLPSSVIIPTVLFFSFLLFSSLLSSSLPEFNP